MYLTLEEKNIGAIRNACFFFSYAIRKIKKKKECKIKMTLHPFKEAVFLILVHYDCLYIDTICGIYLFWNTMSLHITCVQYDCLYIDTICRIYLVWNTMSLHITYGACVHTCPEPTLAYRWLKQSFKTPPDNRKLPLLTNIIASYPDKN